MGWAFNATLRPFYPREGHGTRYIWGWVNPRARLDGCRKCRYPTGIRSPDHPARSESLYRLSYAGPLSIYNHKKRRARIIRRNPCLLELKYKIHGHPQILRGSYVLKCATDQRCWCKGSRVVKNQTCGQGSLKSEFYIDCSVHRNSILIRSNKIQQYAGIYLLQNHYMFRMSIAPIIRST